MPGRSPGCWLVSITGYEGVVVTHSDERGETETQLLAYEEQEPAGDPSPARRVSLPGVGVMAFVALIVIGLGLKGVIHFSSPFGDQPVVQVVVQGQAIELAEDDIPEFNDTLEKEIGREHERLLEELETDIDARVEALFEKPFERVSDYVDWHFSLSGSPGRLVAIAADGFEDHLTENFESRVLDGEMFSHDLRGLDAQLERRVQGAYEGMGGRIESALLDHFDTTTFSGDPSDGGATIPSIEISGEVEFAVWSAVKNELFRLGVSAGIASASTGAVVTRMRSGLLSSRVVKGSAPLQQAVARGWRSLLMFSGRSVSRAAAAGGASTVAAAPSGPAAPLVGAGVFAGTLVASEAALLTYQRHTAGAEMEASLKRGLIAARQDVKQQLMSAYQHEVNTRHEAVIEELKNRSAPIGENEQFFVLGGVDR